MSQDPPTSHHDESKDSSSSELDINHVSLVEALRKPKKQLRDIDRIYEAVRGLKYFSSLFASCEDSGNFDNIRKLCSKLKYESADMGTFVFKQNDPSNDKFYVILSGEVGILTETNYSDVFSKDKKHYETNIRLTKVGRRMTQLVKQTSADIASPESDEKTPKSNPKDSKRPSAFSMSTTVQQVTNLRKATDRLKELKARRNAMKPELNEEKKEENEEEKEPSEREFQLMVARYGHLARILGIGDNFGDGALKNPGSKRSASVLCKTDCEFLVLDAETYSNFVRKNAEKKNEFLLKCFSFISSVSSTQIKNKIVYSFMSEGFPEGHVLMNEGVIVKQPKLYLIEHGECKLEKRHIVQIANPLDKKDIISSQAHWLTICTVGPGTLLGEEVLEYPKSKEQYEYRVTVTSSRLSVLSILKSTFVHIHTELEDQTRLFYLEKKKHRDEIYNQLIHELETKSPKNIAKNLSGHASFARMLNKSSFKVFTQRTMRNSQNTSNLHSKTFVTEREISPQKSPTSQLNESGWGRFRVDSPELKGPYPGNESSRVNTEGGDTQRTHSPALAMQARRKNHGAADSFEIRLEPAKENSLLKENSTQRRGSGIAAQPFSLLNSGQNPRLLRESSSKQSHLRTENATTTAALNSTEKVEPQSDSAEKSMKKAAPVLKVICKNERKTIRMRHETGNENFQVRRDSKQEVFQSAFLEKVEVPKPKGDGYPDNYKFVFSEDKDARQRLILKNKAMQKGVFSSRKHLDYLTHEYRPSTSLIERVNKAKSFRWVTDDSIIMNNQTSRFAISNGNLDQDIDRSLNTSPQFSPIGARSHRVTMAEIKYREPNASYFAGMISAENSPKHFRPAYSLHFSESTPTHTENSSAKKLFTARQVMETAPDSLPMSSGGQSNESRKLLKSANSLSFRAKNPFYHNLLQKSSLHKRLNLKRASVVEKTDERNSLRCSIQKVTSDYF